jgi:hypothetical protein
MIEMDSRARALFSDPRTIKIEIDHHLATDAEYSGDDGYRLVTNASSTCELIVFLAYKLQKREDLLLKYEIEEIFSRNVVLAILTGISATRGGKVFQERQRTTPIPLGRHGYGRYARIQDPGRIDEFPIQGKRLRRHHLPDSGRGRVFPAHLRLPQKQEPVRLHRSAGY